MLEFQMQWMTFDGIVTSPSFDVIPPKMYFVNIGFFKHVLSQKLCIGIYNKNLKRWNAETPGSLVAFLFRTPAPKLGAIFDLVPGVQSNSHCKVWKVANDIHVGGIHRSLRWSSLWGCVMFLCGFSGIFQEDFSGLTVNLWDVTVCL